MDTGLKLCTQSIGIGIQSFFYFNGLFIDRKMHFWSFLRIWIEKRIEILWKYKNVKENSNIKERAKCFRRRTKSIKREKYDMTQKLLWLHRQKYQLTQKHRPFKWIQFNTHCLMSRKNDTDKRQQNFNSIAEETE